MSELIDNRAHRIREMKAIMRELSHEGQLPEVRARFMAVVRQADATEVAQMEEELLAEGLSVESLMKSCDLHSEAVRDLLVTRPEQALAPGHPVDVLRRENIALKEEAERLKSGLLALVEGKSDSEVISGEALVPIRAIFNGLMDVDKHYARKENLLFSILERYQITGPSKVMWGKDDEVRAKLRELGEVLDVEDATASEWRLVIASVLESALSALLEMIHKEERILIPMSLQTLTAMEWGEIWHQSPEIGWCLVDPEGDYRPPKSTPGPDAVTIKANTVKTGAILFPSGSLDVEQLKGIFSVLPVDMTFVDAEDRVRFFTEGKDRVFARPKAIVGRKVEHCHPPGSVHVVEQILSDFRAGRQEMAEFWIQSHGRFIHIRYYAVKDSEGGYMGTLEVTQDLTAQRELTGERRLLAYD